MQRVGEFEKVSFEQFYEAMKAEFGQWTANKHAKEFYDNIKLPVRATKGSAGYDFFAPFELELVPGDSIKVPTGIRVKIDDGWWLGCLPHSGLGFKYRLQLANTMAVIDSDYYHSDNEGHIFIKITNDSKEGKTVCMPTGKSFAQGVFIPYGITYTDEVDAVRNGGLGSTGK